MGSFGNTKPHAVCIPYPAQGHVNPLMQLAKLLHSTGFHITFVNTEFNHTRLIRSKGPDSVKGLPDFRFETIPDGLPPPSDTFDATQDVPSLCDSTRNTCLEPFKELLRKLNSESSSEVPPVSCVISDGVMSFGIKAAEELNIPRVTFWTASACSYMAYLHYCELERRGIMPYKVKDFLNNGISETLIDWIPGMTNIRLKDMPTFINTSNDEIMYDFMGSEACNDLNSSAIIFNTFDEFEHEVLKAIMANKFPRKIYTIGPLNVLAAHMPENESKSFASSLWKEDSNCLEWLNKQESNSVVYVNYGSVTTMSEKHLKEFAWGLANSKHPFLWIIRNDIVNGDSAILPQEFLDEIKDRGLLASWCQQDQVLAHPSVAVFLTHCGWNSTMEAVSHGVPLICWPFFADQQTNCRYACTEWGNGVEVNNDVKRDEIEGLVKEMMEGGGGKKKKMKALEWKKKAEEATNNGGSSYIKFNNFIKEALHSDLQLMEYGK
ncbi:linamarin synthase 2-like [Mercurialis annua]|uniref:linamarin synthase 2-like n=1 Tax=Mercurialis annua TaxID=3986 RepID=UPI00215F5E4C|nr:linamarin synthase 2-like [Mercurialis annua]